MNKRHDNSIRFSGDTKRRVIPSIVVLIMMFILQVLFAVFDARDCKNFNPSFIDEIIRFLFF
jgi:TRAP-type C4-dicarboxylate transport system permease small subunit